MAGAIVAAAGLAWMLAQMGGRTQLAGVGAVGLALLLLGVRQRSLLLLLVLVIDVQFIYHKRFGPLYPEISSGVWALYMTSVDMLLVGLYALWMAEGTMGRDIRRLLERRIVLVPMVAGLTVLPSLLAAPDLYLALGELVRMAWMYALYIYVAARLQTKREIGWVVGALLLLVLIQSAIVLWQTRTGMSLTLLISGEREDFEMRVADIQETIRPHGTLLHPTFFGGVIGPLSLLGLSLAINLRTTAHRVLCLGIAGAGLTSIVLAQSRASLISLTVCGAVLISLALWRRQISWNTVIVPAIAGCGAAILLLDRISAWLADNVGTDHFWLEVDARLELNRIALDIIRDAPIFGTGLNGFETVLERYDVYGLLFPENPVHNLYLLVWAETGIVGLAGLLVCFGALIVIASRLARARDPMLKGLGVGAVSAFGFFTVEELTVFSLRQEWPLLAFWLLAGLSVAGWRIAQQDESPLPVEGVH
jgi:O-antigen ligase